MENRVVVTIAGADYTLVAPEDRAYMEKLASHVDEQISRITAQSHASAVEGATLAAINIADEYYKELEASENLRSQIKNYLDEASRLKAELSETKRELFKLQNQRK